MIIAESQWVTYEHYFILRNNGEQFSQGELSSGTTFTDSVTIKVKDYVVTRLLNCVIE